MPIDDSSVRLLPNTVDEPSLQPRSASSNSQSKQASLWPLLLLLLLVHMSMILYSLPLNRVIEMRLCREHYTQYDALQIRPDGSIPEKLCKINEVQRKLAWLQGTMETTIVVCDFLVTIPFSFIAERYGVRVVLWFNLVPRVFMSLWALVVGHFEHLFPTKAIIAGPFMTVLGYECVFSSTIFTLTSALAQEYVQRASYFSYISSIGYVVSFMGPSLASFTMSKSIWLPFWLNIGLLLLAIPTVMILPDTKRTIFRPPVPTDEETNEAGPLLVADRPSTPDRYYNAFETEKSLIQSSVQAVRKLIGLVIGRRNFQILLLSFFLTALASSDTKLLVQYISKRYEWTFAQAGYMLSAKALVNITLLAVVVPRIIRSSMSTQTVHGSEVRLNYLGAQGSIIVSVVGVLCVAFAFKFWMLLAALMIYAVGSALPVFTMSLVKSPLIALPDSEVQDFSIVIMTKTLGSLVGAPLMTVLWVQAIKAGGMAIGLPYFVSACIYLMAAFVVARLDF